MPKHNSCSSHIAFQMCHCKLIVLGIPLMSVKSHLTDKHTRIITEANFFIRFKKILYNFTDRPKGSVGSVQSVCVLSNEH